MVSPDNDELNRFKNAQDGGLADKESCFGRRLDLTKKSAPQGAAARRLR
jgi:hypothetical protein